MYERMSLKIGSKNISWIWIYQLYCLLGRLEWCSSLSSVISIETLTPNVDVPDTWNLSALDAPVVDKIDIHIFQIVHKKMAFGTTIFVANSVCAGKLVKCIQISVLSCIAAFSYLIHSAIIMYVCVWTQKKK